MRPSRTEIEARILQELEDLGENELASLERSAQTQNRGAVSGDFPITINERVEFFIEYYQTKMPARFTRYLNRSGRYYGMMTEILQEYGLPKDLFYIALIESGFTNTATSHAGAVGPWQFMPATARRFGLRVDNWVDERRDPVKATHAAAQYLKFLYGEFGSWYLAAAGYNAGENKIRRALTMYQVNDFWSISQSDQDYLAEETKQYVPRMIAASIIAKEPGKYGFTDVQYEEAMSYEEMTIHPTTSLAAVAKAAGIPTATLLDLNPELKRAATPPGDMYSLKIPSGSQNHMTKAYASLSAEERSAKVSELAADGASSHRVRSGDTLSNIARRYNCTVAQICALNPKLNSKSTIYVGQVINLPGSGAPARGTAVASSSKPASYTVRSGDTLGGIAQRNNCTLAQIYALNSKLNNKPNIRVGQTLQLPGRAVPTTALASTTRPVVTSAPTTYKVQSGDTLGGIAQRHNCSTAQLYALNPSLNNKPNIRVGQALQIPGKGGPTPTVGASVASTTTKPAAAAASTYKVQNGDTLGGIAQRHNCSTAQLYALNPNLNNKPNIRVGQSLNVPGKTTTAAAATPRLISNNSRTVVHTVQSGDTIYALARTYKLSAQQIKQQLGRETLYVGEKITLQVSANQAENRVQSAPASRAASQEAARYYTVQQGDTLWAVSSKFNVSVNDIKRLNNLSSDRLSVGVKLQLR